MTEPLNWKIFRAPSVGLQAEKTHSELLDQHFGLQSQRIEHELIQRAKERSLSEDFRDWGPALHGNGLQTWVGLPIQSLMTPYSELLRMLEIVAPEPGSILTDLGAGYGRLSFIAALRFPEITCLGFELVQERVEEGNRVYGPLLSQPFHLTTADLAVEEFSLPTGDIHFIYDTGSMTTLRSVLKKLQQIALQKPIQVVGRGRATRHLIETENPWLGSVVPPQHHDTFTLYRTTE